MTEHVDVVVVGAGLSGIGMACHLRRRCPDKTVTILEARADLGGTWDLFRYPGVRSDSDMFTLGYAFNPWDQPDTIADGATILDYIRRTARRFGVDRRIRFDSRATAASWSSADARWTVTIEHGDGREEQLTCSFLIGCTGYYRYDQGYRPDIAGLPDFAGPVVHPQQWPADLDVAGRRVAVIGSGATAVTLVPALAALGAQVTMMQRSPGYVFALPARDPVLAAVRHLPGRLGGHLMRWKNVLLGSLGYQFLRRRPAWGRRLLRRGAIRRLPAGFDVDTHLRPEYQPWDQRLCIARDGDFFAAISAGRADVVTGPIDRIRPHAIEMADGRQVAADVLVQATGLTLLVLGAMTLTVDGHTVQVPERLAYRGLMLAGVPNLAFVVGYANASWTLRADLVAGYVCRLLRHMDRSGLRSVTPTPGPDQGAGSDEPLIPLQSGYIRRGLGLLPRQGGSAPWRVHQNYLREYPVLRGGRIGADLVCT